MIPEDTTLKLNVYKTNESSKYLYVRLRGLTQYKVYLCWNANCDIVLDINTNLDPRSTEYPFNTNREGLKSQYQGIIEAIRDKVSQSPLSIARDNRYKEVIYDNVDEGSRDEAVAMSKVILSTQVSNTVSKVSQVVQKIKQRGGFSPIGGYVPPTIADYIDQYNNEVARVAEENNISKSEVITRVSNDTLFRVNNPLAYSWLIYEDTYYNHPKITKNNLVALTIVWDAILKLMANNCKDLFDRKFYPGIILEDKVTGMCLEKTVVKNGNPDPRCYIMVNPFKIPQGGSAKIALYLMGVAAHELAHCVCGSFEAHGETFSYTREEIMNINLDEYSNAVEIIDKAKLNKLISYNTESSHETSKYRHYTVEELLEQAKNLNVDTDELVKKYPNEKILRMRVIMILKKLEDND